MADKNVCPTTESIMAAPNLLVITHRRLPHWKLPGSVYFVTFRLLRGQLDATERAIVLEHLKSGDPTFYRLFCAVIMPDHVHLLIQPNAGRDLSEVMKGIKGVTSRKLNLHRGTTGINWQDESFDRIIRDANEFDEKLQYMFNNPAEAGLVGAGEEYDDWYINKEACYG